MQQGQSITEINKIISGLPENKLEDLLLYLRQIETQIKENEVNTNLLGKIFKEDKKVLQKLAK